VYVLGKEISRIMFENLQELVIKEKLTLIAICFVLALLAFVFVFWLYAEWTFHKQKKMDHIELVRDMMDGIELSMRERKLSHVERRMSRRMSTREEAIYWHRQRRLTQQYRKIKLPKEITKYAKVNSVEDV